MLPFPKIGSKNTQLLVIDLLAARWPLSQKEICHELHATGITYQGALKAIKQLAAQDIIAQDTERQYSLSTKWLDKLANNAQSVKQNYYAQNTGNNRK